MAGILYFAYGSNLLRERLLARCPGITSVGRAVMAGHRLTFDKPSRDASGKCAFVPSENESLHGVLWNVPDDDLDELDRHEGAGGGYEQCTVQVRLEDGSAFEACTYQATVLQPGLQPFDWYLALVVAGAMQQQLTQDYIVRLRANAWVVDADETRVTRRRALEALDTSNMMHVFDDLTGNGTTAT
jgi:hypothetical protein